MNKVYVVSVRIIILGGKEILLTKGIILLFCIVIDYRSMTLKGLLDYVKEKFGVEATSARRLRNLENNVLYFEDEYGRDLSVLSGFEEGGTRIRLERGDIPVSGNIPIKFKN